MQGRANDLKIGCCGPGMALDKYLKQFDVLEVQQTFYQPPQIKTLHKWRENSSDDFEFTIKAWQLITHKATSPTYKRLKKELSESEKRDAGSFKLTDIVKEALAVTYDCANALKAKSILFQCPTSFVPSEENRTLLSEFFSQIDRPDGINFFFEPRGKWPPEVVRELCCEFRLFHAVDPLVTSSVTPQKIYYRMHGVGGFRYKYDDYDLKKIIEFSSKANSGYVLFNNTSMTEDALRFKQLSAQA